MQKRDKQKGEGLKYNLEKRQMREQERLSTWGKIDRQHRDRQQVGKYIYVIGRELTGRRADREKTEMTSLETQVRVWEFEREAEDGAEQDRQEYKSVDT